MPSQENPSPYRGRRPIVIRQQVPAPAEQSSAVGDSAERTPQSTKQSIGRTAVTPETQPRGKEAKATAETARKKNARRKGRGVRVGAGVLLASLAAGVAGVSAMVGSKPDAGPSFATAPAKAPQTMNPEADGEAVLSTVTIEPLKPDADTTITRSETGHLGDFLPPNLVQEVGANGSVDLSRKYTKYEIASPIIKSTDEMPRGELTLRPMWVDSQDPNKLTVRPEDPRLVILKNGDTADLFAPTDDTHFNPSQMPDTVYAVQWKDPSGQREDTNLFNLKPTVGPNNELTFKPYESQSPLNGLPPVAN